MSSKAYADILQSRAHIVHAYYFGIVDYKNMKLLGYSTATVFTPY